ncbi:hypothetical protein PUMCH_000574 [Australozyma saopauloensis]|uniref:Uncharacterized protein n=1 Tax=Australozyma saopauloensis TaxID=291208 RepID=A0AAX4H454_9ASCO|nr:hypothetical protein PUMCH_000574 [[Candida] saopauloensis]
MNRKSIELVYVKRGQEGGIQIEKQPIQESAAVGQPEAAQKSWIKRIVGWFLKSPTQESADGNADDEEAGLQEVDVNIHGEILDFKYTRMNVIWNSNLLSVISRLSIGEQAEFFSSTSFFHTTVFGGVGRLVSDHKTIMKDAQAMAQGQPSVLELQPDRLIEDYSEVRKNVNSFVDWKFPEENLWGKSTNAVKDEILAEFNEDTQLLVYYLGLVPLMWGMAKETQRLDLGLGNQKFGVFLAILCFSFLIPIFLPVQEIASAVQTVASTTVFQNLKYFAQDPTFREHVVVSWQSWTSIEKFRVCFASACTLMLGIWLILLFTKPDSCRRLNNSVDLERREAFAGRRKIRKTIGDAWPSDISEEDFRQVRTVKNGERQIMHLKELGPNEKSFFEKRAEQKQVNRCRVKIPIECIIHDLGIVAEVRNRQAQQHAA